MSDARQTRYDRRRRSCRTNSEFDSILGEYRFFECRKTGFQTESKNRFIRFFPYRYTTLIIMISSTMHIWNVCIHKRIVQQNCIACSLFRNPELIASKSNKSLSLSSSYRIFLFKHCFCCIDMFYVKNEKIMWLP